MFVAIEIAVERREEVTLLNIHTEKVEKEKKRIHGVEVHSFSNSEIIFIHHCRYSNERLKKK